MHCAWPDARATKKAAAKGHTCVTSPLVLQLKWMTSTFSSASISCSADFFPLSLSLFLRLLLFFSFLTSSWRWTRHIIEQGRRKTRGKKKKTTTTIEVGELFDVSMWRRKKSDLLPLLYMNMFIYWSFDVKRAKTCLFGYHHPVCMGFYTHRWVHPHRQKGQIHRRRYRIRRYQCHPGALMRCTPRKTWTSIFTSSK